MANDVQTDSESSTSTESSLTALERNAFDGMTGSNYRDTEGSNPKDIRDQEEQGSMDPTTAIGHTSTVTPGLKERISDARRFVSIIKKNKGIIGLVSTLGVGGTLLAGFLGPASMIISLTENLAITNDSSSKSFERRFLKVFKNTSSVDPICASATKINIKCSVGSISNSALKNLQKKGVTAVFADGTLYEPKTLGYPKSKPIAYDIDLKDGSGTQRITVAELPEFLSRSENSKFAARILGTGGAMNLRVKAWMGKHIYGRFYNKFGIRLTGGIAAMVSKLEGTLAGKISAFRDNPADNERITAKAAVAESTIRSKISATMGKVKKAGTAYTIAVAGCMIVKAPSLIAAGVAAVQLAQLMPMITNYVLSPGSMAKAAGSDNAFTSEAMDAVGTVLTEKTTNPSTGKMGSALDSTLLLAAIGVNKAKPALSKKFTPGYGMLSNSFVQGSASVSKGIQPACTILMSPPAMYAAMAADISTTIAASATVIGGIVKVAASWVISELVSQLAIQIIGTIGKNVFTDLATNKDIPTARGEELGDVFGTAAPAFFAGGAMARHLPVVSKSLLADASQVQAAAMQFEKEMDIASLSPFDTSSKYTFLGSIVHNLKFAMLANGSYNDTVFSVASNIVRLPQMAMAIGTANAGAAPDLFSQQCSYASDFGLDTGNPTTTPAINIAGLPCSSYTQTQVDMPVEEAQDLMISEGWLDQNVDISMSDTIQNLVEKKFIVPETPLYDFIEQCGDSSTGDYLFNAAGCITPTSMGDPTSLSSCDIPVSSTDPSGNTVTTTGCATDPTDAAGTSFTPVKNVRSLKAISVFLGDYQMAKSLNGEDEGTSDTATASAISNGSGQLVGDMGWPVDKTYWDQNSSLFLKVHNGAGSFTGNANSVDLALPKGIPVYAMLPGTVVRRPLGRQSQICTGVPNPPDSNGGLMIESQYQGKTVLIAYAHGDNVTAKDTVTAGEQIMTLGQVGNSCGPHLHMDLSYGGAGVCLQDIFPLLAANQQPNLQSLVAKATPDCGGRG